MFDDPEFFDNYVEEFPLGLKGSLYFMSFHIRRILKLPTY